ncbi:MAG: hypothetical protein KC505_04940 [Myxococcales bacterium]|nr:hypothetical protein [Myxococcales bacterium]USN51418.1 MAG: hypothetical protein H6731_03145 [Myxococcales bacterium]
MTGRRNIIIAVGAIVLFAAMVGFFITLDVSPQIAYARLFIDVGLIIGLIAAIIAFYRETPLDLDTIIHTLKSLQNGKYKTRITIIDKDPLKEISQTINELASRLEQEFRRQEEVKRSLREELLPGIKQKEATLFEHSYHPELGPVQQIALPQDKSKIEYLEEFPATPHASVRPIAKTEPGLNNPLIDSTPPQNQSNPPQLDSKLDRQDQDLGELFQDFIDAQQELHLERIEYPLFLKTIEKTRNELMDTHHCQGVFFEVVKEENQVALQPRILR